MKYRQYRKHKNKEGILEMKNVSKPRETTGTSISKRIHEMEKRISGFDDTIEEID